MGVLHTAYERFLPRRIKRMIHGPVRIELSRAPPGKASVSSNDSRHSAVPGTNHTGAREFEELERLAAQFPSMGGKEIGPFLRKVARHARPGTSIVEVGSWLGAGTAQLALGVRERQSDQPVSIHCYDRWEASDSEVEKAVRKGNLTLEPGQDTLPWVMQALQPFDVAISFIKGDIMDAKWDGAPISVYVDDAAKTAKKFYRMMKTFGPAMIPGVTALVLMDYHYWEKTGMEEHKCQKIFIENHPEHFVPVEGFRRASSTAFNYVKPLDFDNLKYKSMVVPGGA